MATPESVNNGGPAFPSVDKGYCDAGMSLRDWFAGQALHDAVLAPGDERLYSTYARSAYRYADVMLAERSKTNAT